MKPLLAKDINSFLKRFGNFCDGEFRDIEVISPTNITITFATQDEAKEFDWVSITLEFNGVSDAKLIESSKLSFIDMGEGISIIFENNMFYFAIGRSNNISGIKTSICYIESSSIKYEQESF